MLLLSSNKEYGNLHGWPHSPLFPLLLAIIDDIKQEPSIKAKEQKGKSDDLALKGDEK